MSNDIKPLNGLPAVRPDLGDMPAKANVENKTVRSTPDSGVSVTVDTGTQLSNAEPPIDVERVQEIRKALQTDSYPILPTKIADAMIAARLMLSVS